MEPRYDFARRMARKVLRTHGVTTPPVPLELILFEEGLKVEKLDYPDATAGESWWEDGVGHIAVSPALNPGRLRFTLAHEYGHLLLRHHDYRLAQLAHLDGRLRDGEDTFQQPVNPIEVEANQFAAELLLPLAHFRRDWARWPDVRRLAARYEVSVEAVRWRVADVERRA